MVTNEPPPPALRDAAAAPATALRPSVAPPPSLAVRHARVLYRPVPPVGYDDEGHPESDSKPSDSDTHFDIRTYAVSVLEIHYAARPDFYAASNMGLLFERGNPAAVMAPALLVSFGAGAGARTSYKLWQEPVPDLVMELLSPKTWRRDVEAKPGFYEDLGVREFWLFDPIGKLPRPVNGWRLDAGGAYAPVPDLPDGVCRSDVLNLDLVPRRKGFRFRVPATGELLLDHEETAAALQAAKTARDLEESARRTAETVRDLEESARRAAEAARDLEAATDRRAAETARRAVAARLAELKALLRR